MWSNHSPDEIVVVINEKLAIKYQGKKTAWQVSPGGVIFKAFELNLIDLQKRDFLYNNLKKAKARKRSISENIKSQILHLDNNTCLLCGKNENLSVDHILPIHSGGTNDISNLQTLCKTCNSLKMLDFVNFRKPFEKYYCHSCNRFHFRNITDAAIK